MVLTAGLAFASSRWDGHHGSGYTTGHQVHSTSIQPKTQQPTGSVRSTNSRTGRDWCDQTGARVRTATTTATGSTNCPGRTSNQTNGRTTNQTNGRTSGVQQTRPVSATGAGASTASQARQGSPNQWGDRHGSRDSHCRDGWR